MFALLRVPFLLIPALIALSACSDMRIQQRTYHNFLRTYFHYAAGKGEMQVTLARGPFAGVDDATLRTAVIDAMQGATWGPPVRFVPRADEKAPDFHIAVTPNLPETMASFDVCGESASIAPVGNSGRLHLVMGFCARNETLGTAEAWMPADALPGTPAFAAATRQAAFALIPTQPLEEGGRCSGSNC